MKFLAERGLAFRGDSHRFGDIDNGNCLGCMELMSKFDPFLKAHIEKYGNAGRGTPSYLSLNVCEEFIHLMGQKVLDEVISRVKLAKYFAISVDSTPDITCGSADFHPAVHITRGLYRGALCKVPPY